MKAVLSPNATEIEERLTCVLIHRARPEQSVMLPLPGCNAIVLKREGEKMESWAWPTKDAAQKSTKEGHERDEQGSVLDGDWPVTNNKDFCKVFERNPAENLYEKTGEALPITHLVLWSVIRSLLTAQAGVPRDFIVPAHARAHTVGK